MVFQIPVVNGDTTIEVSERVFGQEYNETLVHQLVVKYLASGRSGTKAQKNRSAVSGGGGKPWRQKGTGKARSGSTRSPIWRTGGMTFASQPRSYDQKLNKKMYQTGIRSILSQLVKQDRLRVCDDLYPNSIKTKEFVDKIGSKNFKRLLLIVDELTENLALSARNLPNVAVLTSASIDPVSLIMAEKVLATTAAVRQIEERLA